MNETTGKYPHGAVDLSLMNQRLNHRLRNFCTGIQLVVEALTRSPEQTAELKGKCALVQGELDHLVEFAERLDLLFAEIPPMPDISLNDIIEQARAEFSDRFPQQNLSVSGPASDRILADGSTLWLALKELIANAGEAAGERGDVTISWELDPRLTISIRNSGDPMPDSIPFDVPVPFATTKRGHNGLGLAITHRMLEAINARWTIQTGRETEGVTVTVSVAD